MPVADAASGIFQLLYYMWAHYEYRLLLKTGTMASGSA